MFERRKIASVVKEARDAKSVRAPGATSSWDQRLDSVFDAFTT